VAELSRATALVCLALVFRALVTAVLQAWLFDLRFDERRVHRKLAAELGANVGSEVEKPPVNSIARDVPPSGAVVVAALASLRKGGVVGINAITWTEFRID